MGFQIIQPLITKQDLEYSPLPHMRIRSRSTGIYLRGRHLGSTPVGKFLVVNSIPTLGVDTITKLN